MQGARVLTCLSSTSERVCDKNLCKLKKAPKSKTWHFYLHNCPTDHPQQNTIIYVLTFTPSLSKCDTLFQNNCRDKVNDLK
jgi:hypothetical protein